MRAVKSWESKCHVWRHWLIRSRAEVEAGCAQGSGAWLSDCYFTLGYFHNALWFGQGGGFWECDGLKYDNSGKNWLKCFWRGFLINPSARMVSTHQACSEQAHPLWPAAHFRLFEQPTPHHGTFSPACPSLFRSGWVRGLQNFLHEEAALGKILGCFHPKH